MDEEGRREVMGGSWCVVHLRYAYSLGEHFNATTIAMEAKQ